ncbi:hypothetical protein [Actinoplanes sp. HUAS TT8]|uniref:hypothetical protein n=1 Tax=Actinoplanes sp. HUAS TT8 TaxID=3447453 RepID=UPI003F51D89B
MSGTGATPGEGGTPDSASQPSAGPPPDPTAPPAAVPEPPAAAAPVSEWARPVDGPATPPPVEAWNPPVPPPDDVPAPLFPFPQPPPTFGAPPAAYPGAYPPPQTGGYPPPQTGAYPPPQPGAHPYPPQYAQPGWPPPPASPAARRRGGVLAATIVVAVAVIGLLCTGSIYMLADGGSDSSASSDFGQEQPFVWPSDLPLPSLVPPGTPTPESTGPHPAASPAKDMYDLNAVCDENAYFPSAPKRAGKAPHPVALLIRDGDGDVRWNNRTYYMEDIGTGKADENTWGPAGPEKVQMAACLDRTSAGSKVRSCEYDDPSPETVTLYRANWRLRVYEVATHRQLLDKKLAGNETTCPYTVLVGPDKKIYAEVSDHTVVSTLKSLVTK